MPCTHRGGANRSQSFVWFLAANFRDARTFDHRGFPLPLGKLVCLHAICIHTSKLLAVVIQDGHAIRSRPSAGILARIRACPTSRTPAASAAPLGPHSMIHRVAPCSSPLQPGTGSKKWEAGRGGVRVCFPRSYEVEEGESILDVASTLYQPVRRLRWHYRFRHHSLSLFPLY